MVNSTKTWCTKRIPSQNEKKCTSFMSSSLLTASWNSPIYTINQLISTDEKAKVVPKEDPRKITAYERIKILSRSWGQKSSKEKSRVIFWKTSTGKDKARFVMFESTLSFFFGSINSPRRLFDPSRDRVRSSISSTVQETIQGRMEDQNFMVNSWAKQKLREAFEISLTGSNGSK